MPLHDYNAANQTPASFRTDLNNLFLAIAGCNASSSGITTTFGHMLYADVSSSGWMRMRNAADSTFNYIFPLGVPGGIFTYSGNPSTNHACKYQGQPLFDTANSAYYIGTAVGTSSSATWAQVQFTSSLTQGFPDGYIAGPPPQYASAATITLPAGLKCRNSADTADIEFSTAYTVDITVSGSGGLSTDLTEAAGTWYYLFAIRKSGDGTINGILTTATSAPTMPSGYNQYRMLPIALRNNASGDLVPFYIGVGWPYRPKILWRDYEDIQTGNPGTVIAAYNVLNSGVSTAFAAVSLVSLVPPISKNVDLGVLYIPGGNQLGKAYTRPTGSGLSNGRMLAAGYNSEFNASIVPDVLTDASQSIDYLTDNASAPISLWVRGFAVTEVN
jgi:hypothetical protein